MALPVKRELGDDSLYKDFVKAVLKKKLEMSGPDDTVSHNNKEVQSNIRSSGKSDNSSNGKQSNSYFKYGKSRFPILVYVSMFSQEASCKSKDKEAADGHDGLPEYVDWVARGAVNLPPPNLGDCGSCWAFAAVGAVEAIHWINTGILLQLSVQEVIDCARRKESLMFMMGYKYVEGGGCKGNTMHEAYKYIAYTGLVKSKDYPQRRQKFGFGKLGADGKCYRGKLPYGVMLKTAITHFEYVAPNDAALKAAVARQPVAVLVDSFPRTLEYKSGVIGLQHWPPAKGRSKKSTHAVLVVGYNRDESGVPYWFVRNSWGNWGFKGFMWLERNVSNPLGVGGMFRHPGTYPCAHNTNV